VRGFTWIAALGVVGCSSGSSGTVSLVTGEEDASAVFAGVTQLDVVWVDSDAGTHTLAVQDLPATSIDLGSVDQSTIGMIEVTGKDDAGRGVLFGSTIPIQFGIIDGSPISLFVQRMGETARYSDPPKNDTRRLPLLGTILGRYFVATGGTDPSLATTSELYDLLTLQTLPGSSSLDLTLDGQAPESMAILDVSTTSDPSAYVIDESTISSVDLTDGQSGSPIPPVPASNYTAADLAGGLTIQGGDGARYVVGGTRTTHTASRAVLRIDTANTPSWLMLDTARLGAAALWSAAGLVVIGGSASGSAVESFPNGNSSGSPTDGFSTPDPTTSFGAAALDGARYVLLAGGLLPDESDPGVRLLDLQCAANKTPCSIPWPALPFPLVDAQVFAANPATGVVVGSEFGTLETHIFVLTSTSVTEVPTKVPHLAARAVANPLGTPGSFLLYGGANELESFVPLPPGAQ
jgi:hypothetical protein